MWKRHCFAWEYKGRRADLDAAFNQLRQYAPALENPPLLIVSDMSQFRVRTIMNVEADVETGELEECGHRIEPGSRSGAARR